MFYIKMLILFTKNKPTKMYNILSEPGFLKSVMKLGHWAYLETDAPVVLEAELTFLNEPTATIDLENCRLYIFYG